MYKNLKYLILLVIILIIPLLFATLNPGSGNGLISQKDRLILEFHNDWKYSWGNKSNYQMAEIPGVVKGGVPNSELWIANNLPGQYFEDPTLFLRTSQQLMKVYIDGKLVYSYGYTGKQDMRFLPGSSWHFVKLPLAYEGKKIEISLASPYKQYSGHVNSMYIGDQSSLILHLISQYGIILIIASVILLIGITSMIIYIVLKSREGRFKSLLYLGLFSILSSIWIAAESKIIQLLVDKPVLLLYLSCISLFLLPIPLLLFIINTYKPVKKVLLGVFIKLFTAFFIIVSILQIFNNMVFINSITVFTIILLACTITTLCISLIEIKKRREEIKLFFFGCVILCSFTLKDIFDFFFSSIPGLNAQGTLQYAILVFVLFLSISLGHYILNILNLHAKNKVYESLAYTDLFTGLNNRNSYEEAVSEVNFHLKNKNNISVIIFDINNLKEINDILGHQIGDRLLFNASEIIKQCFGNMGEIYRIGGDEFTAVFKDIDVKLINEQLTLLKMEIDKYNHHEHNAKISIACGMASFTAGRDKDFNSVLTRADKEMYKNKKQQKGFI
jgi:diguanylate cyclase (GGDEF)-like protein